MWLDSNSGGTQAQYEASLKGDTGATGAAGAAGKSAYEVWEAIAANNGKSQADYLASLKGDTGAAGADTQDLSLSGNTISLVNGGSVDISTATAVAANTAAVASNDTDIAALLANFTRMNNIRIEQNPSSATTITNDDGTVIIEQDGLISLGLGATINIPAPSISNLGNKLTIINRAGNGTVLGLAVAVNLSITGGGTIKSSLLNVAGVSTLGTNSSITIQCGQDPGDSSYYWYQIDSALLGL